MKSLRFIATGLALTAFCATAEAQDAPAPPPAATRPAIYSPEIQAVASPPLAHVSADAPAPAANRILPVVINARIGEHEDRTRFVVEMSDPVKMRVFTLANPNRVVIDLPEVLWRLSAADKPSGTGVVRSYRYGLFRPGDSRFVIDLNAPVTASDPVILPPEGGNGYRMVLDLFPTTEAKFVQTAGWPADLRAKEAAAEKLATLAAPAPSEAPAAQPGNVAPNPITALLAQQNAQQKKIIVIDPGHGGIDSGTVGVDGIMEKNVVLAEGLKLRKALQQEGYTVFMTRETDIFIPLPERVNISRAHSADLFISLHADSNPDSSVNGASVYTLSASGSDKEAVALARKENQSDIIAGVDLSGENSPVASILIALAQRDTMNRSSRFAETAVSQLSRATDILPREPHRSAAFAVLKAPDVPAVLIELGYLSNSRDDGQMGTERWRDGVASAIASAVDRNFASGPPVPPEAADQADK
ncbi:MAG: N-acetylmuramoyl-L-alanine amidase [Rhizomicrobium sp.]|jgi:N-acetylmuramoyl-L-alanine amidase